MAVLVAAIFLLVLTATVTHQRNRSTLQVDASVGVLPFVNRGGDSSDVHLGEGLADELIGVRHIAEWLAERPAATLEVRLSGAPAQELGKRAGIRR